MILGFSFALIGLFVAVFLWYNEPTAEMRPWIDDGLYSGKVVETTVNGKEYITDLEIQSGCMYAITIAEFSGSRILHGMQAWSDKSGELEVVYRSLKGDMLCGGRGSIGSYHVEGGGESGNGHGLGNGEKGIKVLIQLTGATKATLKGFYVKSN